MLPMADDERVPKFLQALEEDGQPHIADMLRGTGYMSLF